MGKVFLYAFRRIFYVGWADCFVGILGTLSYRVFNFFWRQFCGEILSNPFPNVVNCCLRNADRVCTHVGNKTNAG